MIRGRPKREQGMALLTVLLMVTVMSVLAVAALDDIRFGLRRTSNGTEVGQAQWYAIGAEELARTQIRRLSAQNAGRVTNAGGWNGRNFVFPIEGGLISARVEEGGNCFDLNSLVQGPPGSRTAFPAGVRQFEVLLQALGVPGGEAAALGGSIIDWITGAPSGDTLYGGRAQPYRTGGAFLAEVSELRAIQGVTPELYARIRPYVCALPRPIFPISRLSPVNINTLREDQAPLVTMLTNGALPPAEARAWIARRPAAGWADVDAFLSHPMVADKPGQLATIYLQVANGMAGYPSRYFAMEATVAYGRAEVAMSSLFEHDKATGGIRLAARRWTHDE